MQVWVKDGKIISRIVDNCDFYYGLGFSYTYLKGNDEIYAKCSIGPNSDIKGSIDLTKEDGTWSGNAKINDTYDDLTINADCEDLVLKNNKLNGDISFRGNSTDSYTTTRFDLDFDSKGNTQSVSASGVVLGEDIGTLDLSYSLKNIMSLKLPKYDETNAVNIEYYWDSDNWDNFSNDIGNYFNY
jgi:hypothetical protein